MIQEFELSEPLIAPGVPHQIAAKFETGEIEFTHGWGDRANRTCLHGALSQPCSIPGDEIMWSALLAYRGLTTSWNDASTEAAVVETLRNQRDPDEAELVDTFGAYWRQYRRICREFANSTYEQRQTVRHAGGTQDAWNVWIALVVRDIRAARGIWTAWADRADRTDRAAQAAWEAALAWVNKDYLSTELFETLVAPWETVFPRPSEETL